MKNVGGSFTLETSPTVTELAAAQSWPLATQLEIVFEDVNVDGVWDAFVTGVTGSSGFGGAVDQIVVAPRTVGGAPTGLVAVDGDMKSFFESVMAWYKDLGHFDTTVTVGTEVLDQATTATDDTGRLAELLGRCVAKWGACTYWKGTLAAYYGSVDACVLALASLGKVFKKHDGSFVPRSEGCVTDLGAYFGIVAEEFTAKDFGDVAAGAVDHVANFVHVWEAGGESYEIEDLADVLEVDVLGIPIGGIFEDRLEEIQQGLFNLYALIGTSGRGNPDNPANKVRVTKRRVRNFEWAIIWMNWHAALELLVAETYGMQNYSNPTIAAYEQSGKLVAKRNDPSERNNLLAGTVTSPAANFISAWVEFAEADRNYTACLPHVNYDFPPGDDENAHNSNGYIAGIISAVNAVTDAPLSRYFLGSDLVPNAEFLDCKHQIAD